MMFIPVKNCVTLLGVEVYVSYKNPHPQSKVWPIAIQRTSTILLVRTINSTNALAVLFFFFWSID